MISALCSVEPSRTGYTGDSSVYTTLSRLLLFFPSHFMQIISSHHAAAAAAATDDDCRLVVLSIHTCTSPAWGTEVLSKQHSKNNKKQHRKK